MTTHFICVGSEVKICSVKAIDNDVRNFLILSYRITDQLVFSCTNMKMFVRLRLQTSSLELRLFCTNMKMFARLRLQTSSLELKLFCYHGKRLVLWCCFAFYSCNICHGYIVKCFTYFVLLLLCVVHCIEIVAKSFVHRVHQTFACFVGLSAFVNLFIRMAWFSLFQHTSWSPSSSHSLEPADWWNI